jgi:hypothetical protein
LHRFSFCTIRCKNFYHPGNHSGHIISRNPALELRSKSGSRTEHTADGNFKALYDPAVPLKSGTLKANISNLRLTACIGAAGNMNPGRLLSLPGW